MTERGRAIWFLALLSPIIAELMSGSSPPIEFFNPFSFVGLLGMYGAGVLLVREFTVKWGKGWGTIIILGAAYAIIEEGLAVKSFFDPGWGDLGDLGTYGRWWSTNWVWAVWLTIYHATISISLPILIFGLAYPQFKSVRILTDRQFRLVIMLFSIDIAVFALLFLFNYVPPLAQYLLAVAAVALLFYCAKRVPGSLVNARDELPTWKPWKFYFLGLFMIFGSFLVASGSFTRALHPIITIAVLLLISATTLFLLQHRMGRSNNAPHRASFAAGLMTFFVFLGIILELSRKPEMLGMSVVAGLAIVFFVDLNRMVRGRSVLLFFRRSSASRPQ